MAKKSLTVYLSKGHFISKQSNNHSFVILSQRFVLQLIANHKCVILTANNNSVYRFFFLGSLHDLTFITENDTHVFFSSIAELMLLNNKLGKQKGNILLRGLRFCNA